MPMHIVDWMIVASFLICWPIAFYLYKKWDKEADSQSDVLIRRKLKEKAPKEE